MTAAAAGSAGADDCRQNCIHVPDGYDYCTTAAEFDTTIADPTHTCGGYEAAYNVPLGTLYSNSGSSFGICRPQTTVEDDFSLSGIPAGTPVSLTGRFVLTITGGDLMGPGRAHAGMVEAAFNTSAIEFDLMELWEYPESTREIVLSVPITATVGTPIHMKYFVGSTLGELCNANWHGRFDFTDVPGGVSIISCNGYVQAATPSLPTSWGDLKARYR